VSNAHLPDRGRDERELAEEVAGRFVSQFFTDAPREPDVIDHSLEGALTQASSSFTPWRARAKDNLNAARQAPVATVAPEQQEEKSDGNPVVRSLEGLTTEQRQMLREALFEADLREDFPETIEEDNSSFVDDDGTEWAAGYENQGWQ
jgi:hypothetical protein